ncbi:branched-chain amino acid ABC transporter permease [Nocardioides nitrophenolicus]|uniref:branched-chain amino acid ABC transporter permease n=1 Tax=Nocardioides nitrophenolicus TaxID=60489 RepID=UPI001959799C|nr:branched-chain amino acid ABC transporter permease [Nocardioides nitrophenolicus]MBM7516805.1 branched-chain amino acid transport system permease protein [Nocardioides nitrophenolicus]
MDVLHSLPQQLVYGLALGSVYAMIALGYSMVYGVLEFINFSHGEVFMVGAFASLLALTALSGMGGLVSWGPVLLLLMLLAAMVASGALGVAVERLAYRPLRKSSRLAPLISAIGVSLILQNVVMLLQVHFQGDSRPQFVAAGEVVPAGSWEVLGVRISHTAGLVFGVSVVLMLCLGALVTRSSLGRSMRATAQDPEVAGLMGINVSGVITRTFLIGSGLAGAAGCLVALYYTQIDYTMGFSAGIKAFAAAVLGGIGSIRGAMAGGLVLGVTEAFAATFMSAAYKDLIAFALLVLVLAIRPAGLLGRKTLERV